MVTLLIFSIIFAALFRVLSAGRTTWYLGDVEVELSQEIRRALIPMEKELRQSGSSVVSGVPSDGNYYTSITFKIPEDIDGDGDVVTGTGGIEWSNAITYLRNSSNQIIRSTTSGATVLANHISSLQFKRTLGEADLIWIYITAQKTTTNNRTIQVTINSEVKMRN
jgi:hypothetical protein